MHNSLPKMLMHEMINVEKGTYRSVTVWFGYNTVIKFYGSVEIGRKYIFTNLAMDQESANYYEEFFHNLLNTVDYLKWWKTEDKHRTERSQCVKFIGYNYNRGTHKLTLTFKKLL